MHHPQHPKTLAEALADHAARLSFPDWEPTPDDWTSLHTSFTPDGAPYTEVVVYRVRERIHYARIEGDELDPFWVKVINQLGP